ncbi:MAG: SpoVA/SpoVAEb family sporulation membrane protein [Clostridiales bacterium]|nr:SpoVA/SpoVAEb family sporulation membrane protein [Clostridiales bacterium]
MTVEIFWALVKAFVVGGLICCVGQALIMHTKMTSARVLVLFVVSGVALTALGVYKPLVDFAGAGATVPLTGFGYALAAGAIQGARSDGVLGAFTGGIIRTAAGISAAIVFGLLNALLFKHHAKP